MLPHTLQPTPSLLLPNIRNIRIMRRPAIHKPSPPKNQNTSFISKKQKWQWVHTPLIPAQHFDHVLLRHRLDQLRRLGLRRLGLRWIGFA